MKEVRALLSTDVVDGTKLSDRKQGAVDAARWALDEAESLAAAMSQGCRTRHDDVADSPRSHAPVLALRL